MLLAQEAHNDGYEGASFPHGQLKVHSNQKESKKDLARSRHQIQSQWSKNSARGAVQVPPLPEQIRPGTDRSKNRTEWMLMQLMLRKIKSLMLRTQEWCCRSCFVNCRESTPESWKRNIT